MRIRFLLALLPLIVGGAARAQTTVSGPITFGTVFSLSGAGQVSIAAAGIGNAMLANPSLTLGSTALTLGGTVTGVSGLACSGCTLSGMTALPGGGVITSTGQLGIGTNSPAAIVDIQNSWSGPAPTNLMSSTTSYGDSARIAMRRADGSSSSPTGVITGDELGNLNFRGYTSAGAFSVGTARIAAIAEENFTSATAATSLIFGTTITGMTGNAEHMRLTGAGFLGIGTATPNYLVQLNGGSSNAAVVQFTNATTGTGAGNGAYVGYQAGGTDLWIDNQYAGAVKLLANGVEQFRVDSGGGYYFANLPATPGGKQPMCFDTTAMRAYAGSGGAC